MTGKELDTVVEAEIVIESDALPAVVEVVDINNTLTPEAEEDLANTGRENTRETYKGRWKAFATWCADNGRTPGPPTTAVNMTSYISYLRRAQAPPGTLRLTIAAIRHMNARAGHQDHPDQAAALKVYQDHRHAWKASGRSQRSSAPVDLPRIRQMLAACPANTAAGQRNRVILLLGYFMRARASELAELRIGDVEFVAGDLVVATKRVSKNDKTDEGREYEIDDPACLAALRTWLARLAEHGQNGRHLPLIRNVDMWGNLGPVSSAGRGITRQAINNIVKSIARQAKVDVADSITAHGLRAGVPTDLGAQGYTAGEIKDITGDWASLEMVERYRKVGLRRAGKRTDSGTRAGALSMLRALPEDTTEAGQS